MSEPVLKNGELTQSQIEESQAQVREGFVQIPSGVVAALITDKVTRDQFLWSHPAGQDVFAEGSGSHDLRKLAGKENAIFGLKPADIAPVWLAFQKQQNKEHAGKPGYVMLNENGTDDAASRRQAARVEFALREELASRDAANLLKVTQALTPSDRPLYDGGLSQQEIKEQLYKMQWRDADIPAGMVIALLPDSKREQFMRDYKQGDSSFEDAAVVRELAGLGNGFWSGSVNGSSKIKLTQAFAISYNKYYGNRNDPHFVRLNEYGVENQDVIDAYHRVENMSRQELATKDKAAADLQAKNAPAQNEQPKVNSLLRFMSALVAPMTMFPVAEAHQDSVHPGTSGVAPGAGDRTPH